MLGSKQRLQRLLKRLGLYERAKGSWIYDLYWSLADRRIVDDRRKETEFYTRLLQGFRRGGLIFDIGANEGYKSRIFLALGARVVAVEPDEKCQAILNEKFAKYRIRAEHLVVVPKAVSDKSSVRTMLVDAPGSALNTLSEKWAETLREDEARFGEKLSFWQSKQVETLSITELVAVYGSPFFIKIDVEGHELNVLRGMQQPVPYLSFEVNLPEFRPEGLECVSVLERLAKDGRFNYTSDCRRGLMLKDWAHSEEFLAVLNSCDEASIEVFWRTQVPKAN
jgi:FkbM family methyltransferase